MLELCLACRAACWVKQIVWRVDISFFFKEILASTLHRYPGSDIRQTAADLSAAEVLYVAVAVRHDGARRRQPAQKPADSRLLAASHNGQTAVGQVKRRAVHRPQNGDGGWVSGAQLSDGRERRGMDCVGGPAPPVTRVIVIYSVQTRGANRSKKKSQLRKSPSTIQTSVGQPIFSWTIFGQALNHSKAQAFLDLIDLRTTIQ